MTSKPRWKRSVSKADEKAAIKALEKLGLKPKVVQGTSWSYTGDEDGLTEDYKALNVELARRPHERR